MTVLLHHSSQFFYYSLSITISHDLVVYTTLIIPHTCPDVVPPFHFSTVEVLPLPGSCLLGDPLWSHLLEVRSRLNSALPIYCGSLRNLFGYKLGHTSWLVCKLPSFLSSFAVEKDNLVFHAETYRPPDSTLCRRGISQQSTSNPQVSSSKSRWLAPISPVARLRVTGVLGLSANLETPVGRIPG